MHFPATFPVAPGSAGIAETSSVVISLYLSKRDIARPTINGDQLRMGSMIAERDY